MTSLRRLVAVGCLAVLAASVSTVAFGAKDGNWADFDEGVQFRVENDKLTLISWDCGDDGSIAKTFKAGNAPKIRGPKQRFRFKGRAPSYDPQGNSTGEKVKTTFRGRFTSPNKSAHGLIRAKGCGETKWSARPFVGEG